MATREEEGANNKPAPLVPAEVDLRDFAFMPLDVRRLRDSRFVALRTPEEVVAGTLLWCASWHQQPASSVPNDDVELSLLAGYGGARGVGHYWEVKAGSLHGFVLCSDGRWYHRVVAEKAAEAWNGRLKLEWRRACDRIRKENKDRVHRGEPDLSFAPPPNLLENVGQSTGMPLWAYVDSSGKRQPSSGIPAEEAQHSAGKDTYGAGIPASVRARDRGQGTVDRGQGTVDSGQGIGDRGQEVLTPNDAGAQTATSKPAGASPQVRTAQIAIQVRALDKSRNKRSAITSTNPKVLDWANAGITDAQIREAYDLAASARDTEADPGPISAGYLDVFIRKVLNAPEVKPNGNGAWWETEAATRAEAQRRGVEDRGGESWAQFRERIRNAPVPQKVAA